MEYFLYVICSVFNYEIIDRNCDKLITRFSSRYTPEDEENEMLIKLLIYKFNKIYAGRYKLVMHFSDTSFDGYIYCNERIPFELLIEVARTIPELNGLNIDINLNTDSSCHISYITLKR